MEDDRTISANPRHRRAVRLFPKNLTLRYLLKVPSVGALLLMAPLPVTLLLGALLMGATVPLGAQSLSVSGTVRDAQDAPVAGVAVSLRGVAGASTGGAGANGGGARAQQTTTDVTGQYRFDGLAAGAGSLRFTRDGFQPLSVEVRLTTEPQTLDVRLVVSEVSTQIEVVETVDKPTASRMPVPDIEIPVQVTTVPLPVLQEQGANDLITALRNVSGVTAFRGYGMYEYYTVRGFNSSNVVLVDGMRLEGNRLNSQMNNVERVEVLKGPASVLYGGQALSGTINIIRKKPQQQPMFDFFYRGGRFNTHQGGAGAAGQLGRSSSLLYRIDTSFESSDAWRNAGARRLNISPAVTWIPQERIRFSVIQAFNRDNFDGDAGVPVGLTARRDFDPSWRFNTPYDFAKNRDSQTQVLLNVTVAEDYQFRNSFLYRHANDEYFTAESVSYQPALNQVSRQFLYFDHHRRPVLNQTDLTGSFRIAGMKHTFVTGYEYQDFYNYSNRSAARSGNATPIDLATLAETQAPVTDFPLNRVDYSSNRVNAVFWQDQIAIGDRLSINVGGRFDDYLRRWHNDPWADGQRVSRTPDSSRSQSAYTYRAGAVYKTADNQQAYFSSSSFFQPVTTIPADGRELRPETGRNVELGYRWQAFSGRLQTSVAAWRLVRENIVIGLGNNEFDQAGQQSAKGVDFDAVGELGHGITLVANYGFADPVYDDYWTSNRTVNLSGYRPRFVQKHAANLWLTKRWRSGIHASIGTRYVSSMYTSDANTLRLGGYNVFNGAFGYRREFWEWSVNAENLLNRDRYFLPSTIANQIYPGAPINVFTTVRFRFMP